MWGKLSSFWVLAQSYDCVFKNWWRRKKIEVVLKQYSYTELDKQTNKNPQTFRAASSPWHQSTTQDTFDGASMIIHPFPQYFIKPCPKLAEKPFSQPTEKMAWRWTPVGTDSPSLETFKIQLGKAWETWSNWACSEQRAGLTDLCISLPNYLVLWLCPFYSPSIHPLPVPW